MFQWIISSDLDPDRWQFRKSASDVTGQLDTNCAVVVSCVHHTGMSLWPQSGSNWPKIGKNLGIFQIRFQYILAR